MWHSKKIEDIYNQLDTSENGLTIKEKSKRILENGLNILPKKQSKTLIRVFLEQFINPIIYILGFAAIFSLVIGEYADTLLIVIVVLLDAILGTYQEWQAEKSADSLKKIMRVKAKVIRNGEEIVTDSEDLVVGDVVILESGDKVPADIRIITCYNLTIDESFLTGESMAEVKNFEIIDEKTPISDQTNMCFAGSQVMTGRAKGVVVGIATDTEIGKIAADVIDAKDVKTPLVIRMEKFTKQLSVLAVIFAVILIIILYFKGYVLKEIFFLVIALVISAVPEGLPVVLTVALSIATSRMAKRNVIVRKLNSVEGLGSCTVIASDKTGTLTLNEQTLKVVILKDGSTYDVTGTGYNGTGSVIPSNTKGQYKDSMAALEDLAKLSVINNEAHLELVDDNWEYSGDAIDIAFLSFARKASIDNEFNVIGRIPYESEKRYSAAFYIDNDDCFVTVKGSLEKVLSFCKSVNEDVLKNNDELSKKGYRVIAVAKGKVKNFQNKVGYEEGDIPTLEFVGLVGFIDPIRDEAKEAIKKCVRAGIKVVMITGDYPLTASKIAADLELIKNDDEVCSGKEIDEYLLKGEKEFDKFIKDKRVFSRVNPKQKLEIINSYKRQKEFVAVTGDGVNDAPALKGANVGIAMGSGTDVAKDVGSIIITDDNFLSIVSGIEEGRFAYNNIRKVTYLLISCSLAEVIFFLLSIIFNYPIPLLAVQILWLNLVTEGIQDTALAFEKGEKGVMNEKPRRTNESLFDKLLIRETVISGTVMALILFGVWIFLVSIVKFDIVICRSYVILLMVILQNLQVLNCRSEHASAFRTPLKDNKFIVLAIVITMGLQIFASETTYLDGLLKTHTVDFMHMIYLFLVSLPLLFVMELFKKHNRNTHS